MIYGSLCSGIEAATVAWHPLGWRPAFFSEIDKSASRVLAHHYPHVPNHGDMTKFQEWPDHAIDLLVGGTPCQSFSVAGLRKGMADPRGNLALTYLAVADRYRPRWLLWENVPGVLSSNGGRDFGAFLGGLGQLGYGFAYRVLDAQFVRVDGFGRAVPQRRRRVFVVGYLGDWRRAAAVLFERESLCWNSPPRREARQDTAADAASGTGERRSHWDGVEHPHPTLNQSFNTGGIGYSNQELFSQRGAGLVGDVTASTVKSRDYKDATDLVAQPSTGSVSHCRDSFSGGPGGRPEGAAAGHFVPVAYRTTGNDGCYETGDITNAPNTATDPNQHVVAVADTLGVGANQTSGFESEVVAASMAVRRLTPEECETLQGFPRGYTRIPWKKKQAEDCPDGPRYRALGNSMAVNVMRWIGRRIEMVESAMKAESEAA